MEHNKTFAQNDKDLYDVLKRATEEELEEFAALMRQKRWSCSLPEAPKVPEIWQLTAEFQLMGGHTFVNIPRGRGVTYEAILNDAGKRVLKRTVKQKFNEAQTVQEKELVILESIIEDALKKMTPEQREEFRKEVEVQAKKQGYKSVVWDSKPAMAPLSMYFIRIIVAKLVAKEFLKRAGVKGIAKMIGGKIGALLAGPIGWTIAAAWVAVDVAGPAYSVTVPGVMAVTAMRMSQNRNNNIERLQFAAEQADQKVKEAIDG